MKSSEIRKTFLKFFEERGHKILPGSPLVSDDPTLLFTNAGMVPLKQYFFKRDENIPRVATVQKCLRTIDLEIVGHTKKHYTFFEMLGNFSFGDYFKKEACAWGWEFLTKVMKIPAKMLWITIYKGDEEAFQAWRALGVPEERIISLEENFWTMGDTGPCGPCSEMVVDRGPDKGCGKPTCGVTCDCDRYVELWNLVFTQFDRQRDGTLIPLKQKNIDTGMGLERLTAIIQGVDSGFDTDLFKPVIACLRDRYNLTPDDDSIVPLYVIADHIRAATFLISEGVYPSNEGRGYVLRRIIRRAIRHGKKWDRAPFLYRIVPIVVDIMRDTYPQLVEKREYISKVVLDEEKNFDITLTQGMRIMDEIIKKIKEEKKSEISGRDAFRLYDTYGFPLDFIKEIANENGLSVDQEGYKEEMEKQRSRSRVSREKKEFMAGERAEVSTDSPVYNDVLNIETTVKAIFKNDKEVSSLVEGEEGAVALNETCFYAESGGQVGDTGRIFNEYSELEVTDTPHFNLHRVKVLKGEIKVGDKVSAEVDKLRRSFIARHHTATHLLQAALRQVLGSHVEQRGSLVSPDYLRFDFTHGPVIKKEELDRVEEIVNKRITENLDVASTFHTLSEAKKMGALAIFQEKYNEEKVRMISIGEPCISRELCGGTHVKKTGEIGLFKITACQGIAKGIRRIEAVCGWAAYLFVRKQSGIINEISSLLNLPADNMTDGIKELLINKKTLEGYIRQLRNRIIRASIPGLLDKKEVVNGVSVIAAQIDFLDHDSLVFLYESLEKEVSPVIGILGTISEQKAIVLARASEDLKERINLGQVMKEISGIIRGGGGGTQTKAQAQGPEKIKIDTAIETARQLIKEQLTKGG